MKTKAADQLRGYREADLRLVFAYTKSRFSHDAAHIIQTWDTYILPSSSKMQKKGRSALLDSENMIFDLTYYVKCVIISSRRLHDLGDMVVASWLL